MTQSSKRKTQTAARRKDILQAALACFTEFGFEKTTMEQIRQRSGASTGSIYHHFAGKSQLAAALYSDGVVDYQQGFVRALKKQSEARQGIISVVKFHLKWIDKHPDWARYLFQMRQAEFMEPTKASLEETNQRFFSDIGEWFRPHIKAGRLRKLPFDVYVSILIGPCHDFARQRLSGRARTDLDQAIEVLGDAAWRSLRGS